MYKCMNIPQVLKTGYSHFPQFSYIFISYFSAAFRSKCKIAVFVITVSIIRALIQITREIGWLYTKNWLILDTLFFFRAADESKMRGSRSRKIHRLPVQQLQTRNVPSGMPHEVLLTNRIFIHTYCKDSCRNPGGYVYKYQQPF